jgi:ABC-type transport system involved in multi-copper enzyme maturation permease subunit
MNNTLRTIFHLTRADYLERTRRYGFLVTLVVIVLLAYAYVPSSNSGYITLSVDGARGIYNSAWIGNLVAILVGITMPALGFFLVKNAIARDTETGVGQIMATTPLKRTAYTIGKWLSNLSVLIVMLGVTALATIVLQLVLGEDRHIDLAALLSPLLWIVLPTLAFVAAVAILFETIPWLSSSFGNIVFFFICTVFTMASFMPVMMGLDEPALGDVLGIGRPLAAMLHSTGTAFPGLDAGNSSIGPVPNSLAGQPLQTFAWAGVTWTPLEVIERLRWIGVGFVIVLLAALLFNRFDTSRRRYRKTKGHPASMVSDSKEMASTDKAFEWRLNPLNTNGIKFSFGRALQAEMRLIRKGLPKPWFVFAIALFVAGMMTSPEIALRYILPIAWLLPILAWSHLGARENEHHAEGLIFSSSYPIKRQLLAAWLAGVFLAGLTGGGAAINFLRNGETASLVTWFLAILFIPALAVALATWSGSGKLFGVVYLMIWYFGPTYHLVAPLDFLSTSGGVQTLYLLVIPALLGAAVIGRMKQLDK